MSYAQLGQSCQTSMRVLLDNTKFLSPNDPVYAIFYTKLNTYPGEHTEKPPISENVERPEDIKTSRAEKAEEFSSCSSCKRN